MRKIRNNKRNKRFCKGIAPLLMAALLLNQSNFLLQAEESREEVGADVVTGEELQDSDADDVVDTDTETGSDTAMNEEVETPNAGDVVDPDAEEDVNAVGDTDAVSDIGAEDESEPIISSRYDETGNIIEEDAVSLASVGEYFDDGTFRYAIVSEEENNMQVTVTGHVDGPSVSGRLEIPTTALDGTNEYTVTGVGKQAFDSCIFLTDITIPASVTWIGRQGFCHCDSLKSVTILNSEITLGFEVFWYCGQLNSLQIALPEKITGIADFSNEFYKCPDERSLTFLTKDGTKELDDTTKPTLAEAVSFYKAVHDGDGDNEKWYGWTLPDVPCYPVTISVKKDGSEWSDSEKSFALSSNNGGTFITDLSKVPNGTYTIYDTMGASNSAGYVKTGVTVMVDGAAAEAGFDYYTVTFHDGDADLPEYGKIVLKGDKVSEPSPAPTKEGYDFKQWMTAKDGGEEFDFDKRIEAKTDIYASWNAKTQVDGKSYTIKASAGKGGSITPNGDVTVNGGETQRFFITPEEGYKISSVLEDGNEKLSSVQTARYLRAGITDEDNNVKYYDIENVTSDHKLEVYFEAVQIGDDDDNGSGGTDGDDDDNVSGNTGGGGGTNSDSGLGGSGGDGNSSTGGSDSNISAISSDLSAASDAGIVKTGGAAPASGSKEPKTGDAFHVEVYAILAMIVGLFYLLLYFADGIGGMTEEEKRELIARLVRWAEKGKTVRKYVALAVIFMVLVYYHTIGKRTTADWKAVYES